MIKYQNMSVRSVYTYEIYKEFLRDRVQEQRGNLSFLAQIAGCHPSYLSRVVSEGIQLTQDHAHRLCRHWQFDADEREYFIALVDADRAADSDLRRTLLNKAAHLREQYETLTKRTGRHESSVQQMTLLYHSSWNWVAVHFLTSIAEFQTVNAIAERLFLPKEMVKDILEDLRANGLVTFAHGRYSFSAATSHIPKGSPILPIFHGNWRTLAVQDAQNVRSSGLHFTNVQTVSKADYEKLKTMFAQFVQECTTLATQSNSEELVAWTCDIWRV